MRLRSLKVLHVRASRTALPTTQRLLGQTSNLRVERQVHKRVDGAMRHHEECDGRVWEKNAGRQQLGKDRVEYEHEDEEYGDEHELDGETRVLASAVTLSHQRYCRHDLSYAFVHFPKNLQLGYKNMMRIAENDCLLSFGVDHIFKNNRSKFKVLTME